MNEAEKFQPDDDRRETGDGGSESAIDPITPSAVRDQRADAAPKRGATQSR